MLNEIFTAVYNNKFTSKLSKEEYELVMSLFRSRDDDNNIILREFIRNKRKQLKQQRKINKYVSKTSRI